MFITRFWVENEDDNNDIFERCDSESEDSDDDSYEHIDIESIDVNIESNTNEIAGQPVDNKNKRNNNCM